MGRGGRGQGGGVPAPESGEECGPSSQALRAPDGDAGDAGSPLGEGAPLLFPLVSARGHSPCPVLELRAETWAAHEGTGGWARGSRCPQRTVGSRHPARAPGPAGVGPVPLPPGLAASPASGSPAAPSTDHPAPARGAPAGPKVTAAGRSPPPRRRSCRQRINKRRRGAPTPPRPPEGPTRCPVPGARCLCPVPVPGARCGEPLAEAGASSTASPGARSLPGPGRGDRGSPGSAGGGGGARGRASLPGAEVSARGTGGAAPAVLSLQEGVHLLTARAQCTAPLQYGNAEATLPGAAATAGGMQQPPRRCCAQPPQGVSVPPAMSGLGRRRQPPLWLAEAS
ncbi:collagen alpha-1(III) chain-like [Canis lupus familiaris]|uniref:collagen alpha-1(III) chain-like n=1 Tax=Canis lupus familiaris TaxID=9615 RepID=UPI0018F7D8F8|nr:collagen alpha-1(III) chain-like [Canis lupus familiaris]